MENEIQFYGMIAEKLNVTKTSILIDFEKGDVNLRELIISRYPQLQAMTFKIAVDNELKENLTSSEIGKTIAILPPFAGG